MSSTTSYQRFRLLPVAEHLATWWSIFMLNLGPHRLLSKKKSISQWGHKMTLTSLRTSSLFQEKNLYVLLLSCSYEVVVPAE